MQCGPGRSFVKPERLTNDEADYVIVMSSGGGFGYLLTAYRQLHYKPLVWSVRRRTGEVFPKMLDFFYGKCKIAFAPS